MRPLAFVEWTINLALYFGQDGRPKSESRAYDWKVTKKKAKTKQNYMETYKPEQEVNYR